MEEPFYGKIINRQEEEDYIRNIVESYTGETVDEKLKKKVYQKLAMEKHYGRIHIPFKVEIVKDPYHRYPDHLEVILETKV